MISISPMENRYRYNVYSNDKYIGVAKFDGGYHLVFCFSNDKTSAHYNSFLVIHLCSNNDDNLLYHRVKTDEGIVELMNEYIVSSPEFIVKYNEELDKYVTKVLDEQEAINKKLLNMFI